jgi:23S rRNA (cytidine1920-2'-O)/16S rRNA (cytidine1409-2'-O)-methyltransferase
LSPRSTISASILSGDICLDVGASTGGFTEVLLARGANKVYAIDVGRGQLHERLRGDPAVVSLEETDIRKLDPARLPSAPEFVDRRRQLHLAQACAAGALDRLLRRPAHLMALIKPQFEAGEST